MLLASIDTKMAQKEPPEGQLSPQDARNPAQDKPLQLLLQEEDSIMSIELHRGVDVASHSRYLKIAHVGTRHSSKKLETWLGEKQQNQGPNTLKPASQ